MTPRHKPKRVLIFSLTYFPFIGGDGIALKEITDRISPSVVRFDLITLRLDSSLPKEERIGNIDVYRVGLTKHKPTMRELVQFPMYLAKVLYPPFAFFKAISLYRKNRYDAFWSMMVYSGFPIAFFRLFYKRVPYILTLQEGDPIEHILNRARIRMVRPFLNYVFRKPVVTQVISEYLGRLSRRMGYGGTIELVPNGVDVQHFGRFISDEDTARLKEHLGLREKDTVLITTSRLVGKNAVDDVIRALVLLPKHVKFLVVGKGPDEEKLRRLAQTEGVAHRVIFTGHIPNKILPYYLRISDVFVRPSLSEGFGVSFIEAMAAGVPVVATPVGGIVDFLYDPIKKPPVSNRASVTRHLGSVTPTGLFCDVRSPKSIAEAVSRLLKDAPLRKKIIKNAKALVKEKYDWWKVTDLMREKVFSRVL